MDRPLFFFLLGVSNGIHSRIIVVSLLNSHFLSPPHYSTPSPLRLDVFPSSFKAVLLFFFFFFTWCFPAWVEFNLFFCSFLSPLFHLPLCNCCRLRYLYIIDPLFLCVSLRVCVLVWSFCAFSFFLLLLMSPVTEVFHDDLRCFALKVGQPFRCLCCCPR